jgi:hypothetical protein
MRAIGAVARDRDVDQRGIDLSELVVAEAVLFGSAGAEILAEHFRRRDQLVQDLAPFPGLEVQGDALHAAIVGLEIGAGMAGQHGRAARRVAALGHFDLDHLGAEIGHQHVRHRAGLRRGTGDDLDAVQGAVGLAHIERLLASFQRIHLTLRSGPQGRVSKGRQRACTVAHASRRPLRGLLSMRSFCRKHYSNPCLSGDAHREPMRAFAAIRRI